MWHNVGSFLVIGNFGHPLYFTEGVSDKMSYAMQIMEGEPEGKNCRKVM